MTTTAVAATTKEPAWKKFLKLKSEVPVAAANLADATSTTPLKRKREPLAPQSTKSILNRPAVKTLDPVEKKSKANKQRKKSKTRVKRSRKDEAESKAAQEAALDYLSLYCSSRTAWKFSKSRQNYLLKNIYTDLIPDAKVDNLLTYLDSLQGGAKERCLDQAKQFVQRYHVQQQQEASVEKEKGENVDADPDEDDEEEQVTIDQYERAQKIVRRLSAANDGNKTDEQIDEDDA